MRAPNLAAATGVLTSLSFFSACTSVPVEERTSLRAAQAAGTSLPWTSDFQNPALLVADEVHVEGPSGLLEHFALRVEPAFHERNEETTSAGYLQTVVAQADAPVEIRGYLDRLELAAIRRLTVLERPGDVDVIVEARGDVYWVRTDSGEEQRVPTLRLAGRRPPAIASPR